MTITRTMIKKANEKTKGLSVPYKHDVLNEDGLAALMELTWKKLDGCKIRDFFDAFAIFLGRDFLAWSYYIEAFAEAKKAAYKAQKSSTGFVPLADWYIIK